MHSPKPILLLMDSHGSHITPEVIDLARDNDIHILTFPAHTTHILQPLDVGVYKSLKTAWQKEMYDYMAAHPTEKPSKYNFHSIFNGAFVKAMSSKNIVNSFRGCGIIPLNRDAIPKEKLAPSLLTERPDPEEPENNEPAPANGRPIVKTPDNEIKKILQIPTPEAREKKTRPSKRKRKTARLLTDMENQNVVNPTVSDVKRKRNGRKRKEVPDFESSPGTSGTGIIKPDEEDWTCGVCSSTWSHDKKKKNGKDWVQCSFCLTPYHVSCQTGSTTESIYMCDLCSREKSDD